MVRSARVRRALCVEQENAKSRITRKLVYAWLRSAPLSGYPLPSIDGYTFTDTVKRKESPGEYNGEVDWLERNKALGLNGVRWNGGER